MRDQIVITQTQYKILSLLGEGSNSEVYLAQRSEPTQQLSTFVALKVLKSDQLIDVWKREFKSLSKVSSRHCVRVFSFEWIMKRPALVLEYVEGLSLYELLNYCVLTPKEVLEIGSQILKGLKDLQDVGLSHGDLSPTNALIDKSGQVKLLDFGLGNWTQMKRFATPLFTAPEVEDGQRPSFSSDLYSLGKVVQFLDNREDGAKGELHGIVDLCSRMNPGERAFNASKTSEDSVKRTLSQKVGIALREKEKVRPSTKEYTVTSVALDSVHTPSNSSPNWRALWGSRFKWQRLIVLSAVLVLLSLGALIAKLGKNGKVEPAQEAQLLIRPEKWREIWVNGERKGYTPLDLPHVKAGQVTIRWQGLSESGARTLTLAPGENIVLDESFFLRE